MLAHPSSSKTSLSSSSEDIEMSSLQEVVVTPNPALGARNYPTFEEEDDDASDFDEGDRALLSNAQSSPRWREKAPESAWSTAKGTALETLPTLLFTTVGTMLTGELLDHVSRSRAMTSVNELIMIIPVMLNLKGNLEMNLSARLGTAANMGDLDEPAARRSLIIGNLALLQVQASLVSFVAACFSFVLSIIIPDDSDPVSPASRAPRPPKPLQAGHLDSKVDEFFMVASCAMAATCLSAAILGSFMCGLIVLCRKLGRDPDNIAPPIAACLGDLVTLLLFGLVAALLINFAAPPIFPALVILLIIGAGISCAFVVRRNKYVNHLLREGWVPLFSAMVITSGSGIVLDMFVERYEGYALLAIAFAGLPGGTGSILVSRLSTILHAASGIHENEEISKPETSSVQTPSTRIVMLTLFTVGIPVEIFFLVMLGVLGWLETPVLFSVLALAFLSIAVAISLILARYLTTLLWRHKLDPDMCALPIHSALMDLTGQLLLVSCFELARAMGLKVTQKKHHKKHHKNTRKLKQS